MFSLMRMNVANGEVIRFFVKISYLLGCLWSFSHSQTDINDHLDPS